MTPIKKRPKPLGLHEKRLKEALELYYEEAEAFLDGLAEKFQKLWQEYNAMITLHAPIIRRLEFLETNFPKVLEALKP